MTCENDLGTIDKGVLFLHVNQGLCVYIYVLICVGIRLDVELENCFFDNRRL